MKRFNSYWIALTATTVWGGFASRYLGVEDGSSGFSPFGWVASAFFLPGLLLSSAAKGGVTNADMPLAGGLSWLMYALAAVLIISGTRGILGNWRKEHRTRTQTAGAAQHSQQKH